LFCSKQQQQQNDINDKTTSTTKLRSCRYLSAQVQREIYGDLESLHGWLRGEEGRGTDRRAVCVRCDFNVVAVKAAL
jgi:hypothetical protein